jgi:integrase
VWKGERIYFTASILGVATGLRQGEIRGLRIQDVRPQYVTLCGSWEEKHGLHGAKWGSERLVPIPSRVAIEPDSLVRQLPHREAEDLVFCGANRGQPVRKEELEI